MVGNKTTFFAHIKVAEEFHTVLQIFGHTCTDRGFYPWWDKQLGLADTKCARACKYFLVAFGFFRMATIPAHRVGYSLFITH